MADIHIPWQTVKTVAKAAQGVVTGEAADASGTSGEPTLLWQDKPLLVFVCDESAGCEAFDKIEEVVLKDEKVALGMKAFRTLRMHPDDVAADPILKDQGKDVPRMLLVDPSSGKVKVLETKRIKPGALYAAMKTAARGFWKENLDAVVKQHLKLLTEQDKLANAEKTLEEKKSRLDEGEDRKADDIASELDDLQAEKAKLREQKQELWKLTPKVA